MILPYDYYKSAPEEASNIVQKEGNFVSQDICLGLSRIGFVFRERSERG